jgi:hypothetical protein
MDEVQTREKIVALEARIEELAAAIESCRKIILLSRVAIAAGGLLLAAIALGAVGFHPGAFIGAIAALLGGIVLLGSNSSTAREAAVALNAAEAQRAALIERIDLKLVDESEPAPRELPSR